MDKIEIVFFETDGGVRLGRNRPTVITELTYCEWRRNGTEEFAKATDRSFTKNGEGGWGYIRNDVRETLALMIAPSIVETSRPFAAAADWHDGTRNEVSAYPSLTLGELRAARDLVSARNQVMNPVVAASRERGRTRRRTLMLNFGTR